MGNGKQMRKGGKSMFDARGVYPPPQSKSIELSPKYMIFLKSNNKIEPKPKPKPKPKPPSIPDA